MIEYNTSLYWIIAFLSISLIYFIVMVFVKKLTGDVEKDILNLKHQNTYKQNADAEEYLVMLTGGESLRARIFQEHLNNIKSETISLFIYQTIIMLIFAFILILLFIWFASEGQYWWMFLAFIIGIVVTILVVFTVLILSNNASSRVLINATQNNHQTFTESYLIGNIIGCGALTIILIILLIEFVLYELLYFKASAKPTNNDFFFINVVFSVGVSITSIFYREIGGNIEKGILLGSSIFEEELKDDNSPYCQTLRQTVLKSSILGNQYSHNLTFILDFMCLLISIFSCTILLAGEKEKLNLTTFYLLLFVLSFNILMSLGISWIVMAIKPKKQTSSYIANQVRIQYLIINIISLLFNYFMPFAIYPKEVVLGDGKNSSFYDPKISRGDFIYCILLGQFTSVMLVIVIELFTSHGHQLTRKITQMVLNYSQGHALVTAQQQGNFALAILLGLISVCVYEAYILGGFYGISCTAVGFLQSAAVLLSMSLCSSINNDSYQIALLNQMEALLRDRIYLIKWSCENFTPFIQGINISAGFLSNLVILGAIVQLSAGQGTLLYEGTAFFGFFAGVALIYLIKYFNGKCVRDVSIDMIQDVDTYKKVGFNECNLRAVTNFVRSKFTLSFPILAINLILCFIFIFFVGVLLGKLGAIGFSVGLVFVSIIDSYHSLIVGTSIKNAKNYLDQSNYLQKNNQFQNTVKEYEAIVHSECQYPGTGLLNYVNFCLLFLVIAAKQFSEQAHLSKNILDLGDKVTGWPTDWLSKLVDK